MNTNCHLFTVSKPSSRAAQIAAHLNKSVRSVSRENSFRVEDRRVSVVLQRNITDDERNNILKNVARIDATAALAA